MSFSSLSSALDSAVLSLFGDLSVTIHFSASNAYRPDLTLQAITKNPAYEEDYVPSSPASSDQGVSVLILFVHLTPSQLSSSRYPLSGDTATIAGVDYDIFRSTADREDGRTLYLRRRNQRWDQ
jgi:hypothetical protein